MPRSRSLALAFLAVAFGTIGPAHAAGEGAPLLQRDWSHQGIFGSFDRAAAQRGFQVYREVCAGCHGLHYVAFRNLGQLGFSEDEIKALAAEYYIVDGPNDQGEMFERPGRPSDLLPSPYPNEQAARVANGGAYPPDLSLITKAREGGADYVYSLMLGYEEPPVDAPAGPDGTYYNIYFPSLWIGMPQPLYEDSVTYADGTPATVDQMAADVAEFLTWAGEPTLEVRKQSGLKVMLFLIVLTALLYASKRKIWAAVH